MYFQINIPGSALAPSILVPVLADRFMAPTVKAFVDRETKTTIAIVYDTPFPDEAVLAIMAKLVERTVEGVAFVKIDQAVHAVGPAAEKHLPVKIAFRNYRED